jgi:hypothetical protein
MNDKHIVDYTVIGDAWEYEDGKREAVFYSLIPKVKEMINQGWQPYGSMVITTMDSGKTIRQQAMVKYGQPTLQRPNPAVLTGRE